ncbi:hypothetical protein MBLNU457_5127t1 [Dothideomycetes sp. NU457]
MTAHGRERPASLQITIPTRGRQCDSARDDDFVSRIEEEDDSQRDYATQIMTFNMSQAPTTPKSNTDEDGNYASWLPRDISYNVTFENSVCDILTSSDPSQKPTGLRILADDATEQSIPGVALRMRDIDTSTLPIIPLESLPLDLSDPRRKYASPIPGINLTHPFGYLEGGPGIAPSDDEFARHFIHEHKIRGPEALKRTVEQELEANMELARERMRARKEAREKNERIEREIKSLGEQIEMEIKVLNKAREKARERREKRERRKVGR